MLLSGYVTTHRDHIIMLKRSPVCSFIQPFALLRPNITLSSLFVLPLELDWTDTTGKEHVRERNFQHSICLLVLIYCSNSEVQPIII